MELHPAFANSIRVTFIDDVVGNFTVDVIIGELLIKPIDQ